MGPVFGGSILHPIAGNFGLYSGSSKVRVFPAGLHHSAVCYFALLFLKAILGRRPDLCWVLATCRFKLSKPS